MKRLLADEELERSWVVANSEMNRQRSLTGSNGYGRELGIDVLGFIAERLDRGPVVRWLDLCCGEGRALFDAAARLDDRLDDRTGRVEITGVDLVGYFAGPERPPLLRLVTASVTAWAPPARCDLITIVHGLHYVGDKLRVLAEASSWLTTDGLLAASLDLDSLRSPDGPLSRRTLLADLRLNGLYYSARHHRITRTGGDAVRLPYRYLGADAAAGPNYTGQDAVASVYLRENKQRRRSSPAGGSAGRTSAAGLDEAAQNEQVP